MKTMMFIIGVVGITAGAAWAVPTYHHSVADLGGGLFGHTFTCDNTGELPSAWFVEMEWWGASQAEVDAVCEQGAIPGTLINQVLGLGYVVIHEEQDAINFHYGDPNYDMTLDTWIMHEFIAAFQSRTEGPNYYERQSGTEALESYVVVDHAYIVSDGSVAYNGRVAVGLVNPVWTNVSGVSCVPEPATLSLLALGCIALIGRRRRPKGGGVNEPDVGRAWVKGE